jgi:hypothetical protein
MLRYLCTIWSTIDLQGEESDCEVAVESDALGCFVIGNEAGFCRAEYLVR